MCVDNKGYPWERPATEADAATIGEHFPNIDFAELLAVMSQDMAKPLTTDLVLIGAMLSSCSDDLGMCYVPFTGLEAGSKNMVKLPVMDQVVDWFENSALGTDMWHHASDWCEKRHGGRFHFCMNCGCGFVSLEAHQDSRWKSWQVRFNLSRASVFGATSVVRRDLNSILNTDITDAQLAMWHRIRTCLESLPSYQHVNLDRAA
ncbi:hypothetical protein [Lacipirellula parvula]|uniref:Uncharacterized protein n=1 Tax=Lacipirellula parvula TaxID=2650471 RepID=A0A5K7XDU2_9BACT|nr:hypothetical protein [Lacipirellula parvula]BBO34182.1 hypothetical protein PLANPX_3794 [Lacipirellula parvula]